MTKNEALYNAICEVVNIDNFDFTSLVNVVDIDKDTTFDQLTDIIANSNGFDVEMIYYSIAMQYLMENDASLTKSLEIASNFGFDTLVLNSEILASLLATETVKNEWYDLESEITEIIDEFEWESEE